MVTLGNDARRAQGVGDLTVSECAQQQALTRAKLLVAEGRFEHDPLEPILAACGGRTVGENLALGYPTAKATVDAWLASPGHRANLLSKDFTSIGVACVDSARGTLCAQVFLG
ncbi:CAP domain-containing protein [Cellulomonas fimi]|uniref:CAP domain-containing protein n=1 Tax=Cellulomonas fimi TaxID=1708 RepID=UPI0035ADCDA7